MRVVDKVAEWLEEKNISHGFGIIGGGNCALFDAIHKRGFTQLVACHHEQACAMSSCYFNRTAEGLKSVVLVTTGAGSSNALTGVLAAWMDAIPLLVISGNESSDALEGRTRILGVQGYRSTVLAESICKATVRPDAHELIAALEQGLDTALSPRCGPVWVDIPKNIAGEQCT